LGPIPPDPTARAAIEQTSSGLDGRSQRRSVRVEPPDLRLRTKPGPLSPGEGDVPAQVLLDRLFASQRSVDERPGLAVADGRERRQGRVVAFAEAARLLDEARVELLAGARGDPDAVEIGFDREADPGDGRGIAAGERQRGVAAEGRDLERPRDAARVVAIDPLRQSGRDRLEPIGRRCHPSGKDLRFDLGPSSRVRRERLRVEPAGNCAQVEPGATDEDRQGAAVGDLGKGVASVGGEVRNGKGFVGVDNIQAVVRYAGSRFQADFRGSDVEAAIHLPGVSRDALHRHAIGNQRFGEADRKAGLAGRGGAREHEQWRQALAHEVGIEPRSAYGPA